MTGPRYLVVNGDDFGLSAGVNRGVIDAHRRGILTSASLLVEAPGARNAASLARTAPRLGVGLHLELDDEGVRDPAATARRQLERFEELLGRPPTHLDCHHNRQREPGILEALVAVATQHRIPLREHSRIRYVSRFYGRWDGGAHPEQLSVDALLAILRDELGTGVVELGCHPGYVDGELDSSYRDERELEVATLCSPRLREALERSGVHLVDFALAWRLVEPVTP